MTIYEQAKAAGLEMDHHETDLYLKDCEQARKLIADFEFKQNVTRFKSQIDGSLWYDIPFSYDPAWKR